MRRLLTLAFLLLAGPAFGQSHPVFFQRAADLARYSAMKANYDANPTAPTQLKGQIYKYVKTQADSGTRYQDYGQFAALMYSWTCAAGACDTSYVTKSWTQLDSATPDTHPGGSACAGCGFLHRATTCNNAGISGNYSREYGWTLWLIYDQLYSGLSAGQRTTFLTQLNAMAACVTATGGPAGWVFRATDTDQTTGDYFAMAMAEVSTGSYNTTLHGYWNDSTRKLGGFTATAADGATYRNAVKKYITDFAADGEWVESAVYNLNTIKLATLPAEALRSVQTPTDNYPEITTWQPDAAEQMLHMTAPGISTASMPYQWGDTQSIDLHTLQPQYRFELCLTLAGLTGGTAVGGRIRDFCMDWLESAGGGSAGLTAIDMYPRGFLVFDEDAARGDHTTAAKSRYLSGMGIQEGRTGWTSSDTAVWFHMPPQLSFDRPNGADPIDHQIGVWGEFQMLKANQFAMMHPLTYGGPSLDARGTSGLTIDGVPNIGTGAPWAPRFRNIQAHEDDDTNRFMYLTGTQGGPIVRSGYFGMPTNFFLEHTRSMVWLKDFDAIIIHDRANGKAVSTGWNSTLQTWMNSRPRKELYIASPVSPTQGSGYLDWAYAGSNHTRVSLLLPPSPGIAVESEATVWVSGYYGLNTVAASEKKYHTIITPSDQTTQFHTFLNCWDAYGTGTIATCTLVQDLTNKVDAALFSKGSSNVLLAFNAIQGQDIPERTLTAGVGYYTAGTQAVLDASRKRTTSFSLNPTIPGGSTTKILLFDLDTAGGRTWTYQLNGGSSTALSVDSSGVGVINTALTGSVTIAVATSGIADLVITTTSPITNGTKDVAYTFCFVATGGVGPYTWSKSWTLPTGVTLNASTGCLSGTPTQSGTFGSGSVTVTDSQGSPDTATLTPVSLTIDVASTPTVITTTSLSNPTVNIAYTGGGITVTGGTGTYTCSLVSGQLPTGLSLSATCSTGITGTATSEDQSTSFTVRACDDAGSPSCDDQDYSLHVDFTNNTPLRLSVVGYADDVIYGYFGAPGLASGTSCTASLTGQSPQTTTTGGSNRFFQFESLTQSTSYDLTVSCVGYAFPITRSITTRATRAGNTSTKYSFYPSAALLAQGVAKMELYASDTAQHVLDAVSLRLGGDVAACTTGCSFTGILPQGLFYYQRLWTTSGDVVVKTGPMEIGVIP